MCFPELMKRKVSMTNWQIGVLKLSVACLAIAIGCYFAEFFRPYLLLLVTVGVVTSIWITVIWLKAMKENS
jgi:hypothetical protein